MAILTYTEQLEQVQAAITAVLTKGQSYTIDGRTFTRADLGALQEREQYLMPLAQRETRGGLGIRLGVPRSS